MEAVPKGSKAHLVPDEYRSNEINSQADAEFYLHTRPPISNTLEEYKEEICKYVQVRLSIELRGIGLVELNRRFYHTGRAFGVPASKVAQKLVSSGALRSARFGTTLVLFPGDYDCGDTTTAGFQELLATSLGTGLNKPRRRRK